MKPHNFCKDCDKSHLWHISTWIEDIIDWVMPKREPPIWFTNVISSFIEKILTLPGIGRFRTDIPINDIPLRSLCFMKELEKRGAIPSLLYTFGSCTSHMKVLVNGKVIRFEGLPTVDWRSTDVTHIVSDKERTKQHLKKGGFPIATGNSFTCFEKKKAVQYGAETLGFPLVIKPRSGSVSRHVTTNISTSKELERAIAYALEYSPTFLIERFIPNSFVYRATVIDFNFVVCVQQVTANVVGDGISNISTLIRIKNESPNRGETNEKQFTLYRIKEDDETGSILQEHGYTYASTPKPGEVVYLKRNPFLKLGGDLVEVTPFVHKDNVTLFRDIAKHFNIHVTGIDFIAPDISISWKEQRCAILELNGLPCIEMHHFPSSGIPTNPGGALVDMFYKYYV